MKRRQFIQAVSTSLAAVVSLGAGRAVQYASRRPPVAKRKFVSPAVERLMTHVAQRIADPELAWLFQNCYANPLDTTVEFRSAHGGPDTFVLTGDIPAMWQRDTMYQLWPYLPLLKHDAHLRQMMQGAVNRLVRNVALSPYANAFLRNDRQHSPWRHDLTHMQPGFGNINGKLIHCVR